VKATVDGKLAVRGTLTFAVGDEDSDVGSTESPSSGGGGVDGAGAGQ
jgi:hypothetical protein